MPTDDPTQAARSDEKTPLDNAPDGTVAGGTDRAFPIPETAAVTVPGYEVFGELGRGAMGVVYKARQVKLNRVVALKMVLVESATLKLILGESSPAKELIRFLAEAEAVAAIKHPNVVQVYEYGVAPGASASATALDNNSGLRSDGRPYLALEFLPGGTLGDRLTANPTMPARDAAVLLARVARGAAAAHALGIVHRDLKPGNILFDADGTPKVTDFGIAKRIDRTGATSAGDMVGTPAYMSPEQAAGDGTFVGPPADVWALGVILYECLTGMRPFTGTFLKVLVRISQDDPVAPREVVASVPRDLDLICLKCLAKSPAARYATAKELADDLDRFVRGEPVAARPVGPVERGYMWTRRNKVVSAALAAVALALVVGAGVSFGFGLEARKQAERASEQAARADRERDDAVRARHDAQSANDRLTVASGELQKVNGALEVSFAESLLGPLTAERREDALTANEVGAFRELAARRNTRVPHLFLEAAARTPLAAKQLECRAEFALHAAVGLDPHRRVRAESVFASRLTDRGATPEQRLSLALALSRWEPTRSAAAPAAAVLSDALAGTTDSVAPFTIARAIVALAARMDPDAAVAVLTGAMSRTAHPYALRTLAECLAVITARMRPNAATGPRRAAAKVLSDAITKTDEAYALAELADALARVAPGIGPDGVDGAAVALLDALVRAPAPAARRAVANSLVIVAAEMSPASTAAVRDEAARFLTSTLTTKVRANDATARELRLLAEARIAVAPLTPAAADLVAKSTVAALARTADPDDARVLIMCLRTALPHLEPDRATAFVQPLTGALNRGANPSARAGLVAVAARAGPDVVADLVTAELIQCKNLRGAAALAESLVALGAMNRPARAAARFDAVEAALVDALGGSRNPFDLGLFAVARTNAAAALIPDQAAAVRITSAKSLLTAMAEVADPNDLKPLAAALVEVIKGADPVESAALRDAAAKTVARALAAATEPSQRQSLASALATVARKLEPEEAAVVAQVLVGAVTRPANEHDREESAARLGFVAVHMRPVDALQLLTGAITDTNNARALCLLAERVAAVVPTASSEKVTAARGVVAKKLIATVATTADPTTLAELLTALAATEPRPTDAARAGALLDTLARTPGRPATGAVAGYFTAGALGLRPGAVKPGTTPHILPWVPAARPLPAPALVELLKHPFCVGEARQAILDALAFTYNRPFADQWEFVEYAQKHQPQLDLLTPPARP